MNSSSNLFCGCATAKASASAPFQSLRKLLSRALTLRTLVAIMSISMLSVAIADSWLPAKTISATSENAEWLIRVEPGDSVGNVFGFAGEPKGEYAEATLFKYDRGLENYTKIIKYRTRNPIAPVDILVSNSGWLVALDNWHNFGIGTVVATYDSEGTLVRELN